MHLLWPEYCEISHSTVLRKKKSVFISPTQLSYVSDLSFMSVVLLLWIQLFEWSLLFCLLIEKTNGLQKSLPTLTILWFCEYKNTCIVSKGWFLIDKPVCLCGDKDWWACRNLAVASWNLIFLCCRTFSLNLCSFASSSFCLSSKALYLRSKSRSFLCLWITFTKILVPYLLTNLTF